MTIYTGTGRGGGGGGILIPYFRYFFTLIPHPTLVYVSSLFRILLFLFPNPRRTLKKTDFDAKANKCKIWIGPYDVKAIP